MTDDAPPLVSVIIPTRDRPDLVGRAVRSALAQTLESIEVIVIIDGPDEQTRQALGRIADRRVQVRMLPSSVGGSDARNAGVAEARGRWVAFLDDDDEWLPSKLELQVQAAERSDYRYPVVSCKMIARSEGGDRIWPWRLWRKGEPISEYLFCRDGVLADGGRLQTSTLLAGRELLRRVPFTSGLPRLQDWDWLLRAGAQEGFGVEYAATGEPLAVWNVQANRPRMGHRTDWRQTLGWIRQVRALVTRRAYAALALRWASAAAAVGRDWRAFGVLLWEACRRGRPTVRDVAAHAALWLVPARIRRRGKRLLENSGR